MANNISTSLNTKGFESVVVATLKNGEGFITQAAWDNLTKKRRSMFEELFTEAKINVADVIEEGHKRNGSENEDEVKAIVGDARYEAFKAERDTFNEMLKAAGSNIRVHSYNHND